MRKNSFWDMLVFRKVQEGMGGKLRLMLVGSAPLAENVLNFVRCALGCLVSLQYTFLTTADRKHTISNVKNIFYS